MILRRNRGGRTRILAALAASAWLAAPAWGSPTYSVRRMENVNFSRPNDSGQILAGSHITNQDPILLNNQEQTATTALVPASTVRPGATGSAGQAALYDGGAVTLLGTLGGSHSSAKDLNDAGQSSPRAGDLRL